MWQKQIPLHPIAYEGTENVVRLMEQYSQQTFREILQLKMQETEEGYLMTVQLLVPLTFDENPRRESSWRYGYLYSE